MTPDLPIWQQSETAEPDAKRPSLLQIYTPVFVLMVAMEGTDEYGDPESLATRTQSLLASRREEAVRWSMDLDWVMDAQYAVVSYIDETISRSTWEGRAMWQSRPLCNRLGMQANAGEGFFLKLADWLRSPSPPPELLAVFYTCLGLGFQGKHFANADELRDIKEDLRRRLTPEGESGDVLAPNGARPPDKTINVVDHFPWTWFFSACLALLSFTIIFLKGCSDSHIQELLKEVVK